MDPNAHRMKGGGEEMLVLRTAHGQLCSYICRYNTHTKDKPICILRENIIKITLGASKVTWQIKELDAKTDV